jgi:hypothetical protein
LLGGRQTGVGQGMRFFFIEVIKAGRFDIIAEFNPYCLTQETRAGHRTHLENVNLKNQ